MLFQLFNRKYAFTAAVLLFSILCYQVAIKKTIAAWQVNKQFRAELAASARPGVRPDQLSRKQKDLQTIVDRYSSDSSTFRSEVIAGTALIAGKQQILVKSVPVEEVMLQTARAAVETVSFSGTYFQLLSALQALERSRDIGIVRSVKFTTVRAADHMAAQKLHMTVYLQVIKK